MSFTRTSRAILGLPCLLVLTACPLLSKPTVVAVSKATQLIVVQGNSQVSQAGRVLPAQIVLRAVDDNGQGVAKQVTTLVIGSGGGVVSPGSAVSDSSGEMKVSWTLGSATTVQQLVASLPGDVGVSVKATAVFPTSVIVAQGQSQSGKVATALKNDVVVRVVGASNAPMVGVPVSLQVSEGGGAIAPQSGVTNALGEFSTKWTMGGAAGGNTLVASSGDLPVATIRATATP